MPRTRVTNGRAVLACRERMGISQKELADRVGVTQAYMSQIETGVSSPGMATGTAHKLAAVLGTSLEAITVPFDPEPEVA